ncbi:hypothetical protein R3P38DRAFT_2778828 [Favolaschia claudopus]|uniref:Uncharacterized protein n=1 Tax=Favolaschia claudopus TaxID=2862362 RepID=A0AAW0BFH5_9AGAR
MTRLILINLIPLLFALNCDQASVSTILGIEKARNSLGPINTAKDIGNAGNLLTAQLALLQANNAMTNISVTVELHHAQPELADQQKIIESLTGAQAALNKTALLLDNSTSEAVQAAKNATASALIAAQQILSTPCTLP